MDWVSYFTGLVAGILVLCFVSPENWPAGLCALAGGVIACILMKVAERVPL